MSRPHRCARTAARTDAPGRAKSMSDGSEYRRVGWGSLGTDLVRSLALVMPSRFGSVSVARISVSSSWRAVAGQGFYHEHADAIWAASWTAIHSNLTGGVVAPRWDLAGYAGLHGHAVRLMKRRGRHGLGGSCDGQNKSNSDQPDHCHLHMNLPMTHPIARTKPMGPGLAFVHKRSAH